MLAIFKREIRGYFTSVVGYVFMVIFLTVAAAVFCYTTLFSMTADVTSFFVIMLLFSAIILPLLTMKSFSEERKIKTEQLLLTSPVSITGMVIGKFLAAYAMFASALIFTSLYFLLLIPYAVTFRLALLLGNIVALLLVGAVFIAIGIFVSALTENQLSAAIGTIAIILGFLVIGMLGEFIPSYAVRWVFDSISIFVRFNSFTAGYFDVAAVVFYVSLAALFIYLTVRVYDRRRYN